jgi:hypothetical protein
MKIDKRVLSFFSYFQRYNVEFDKLIKKVRSIAVASRSKLWVYCRSLSGIAASNSNGVMDISVLSFMCCVGSGLCVWVISSRGVLPNVACRFVIAKPQ